MGAAASRDTLTALAQADAMEAMVTDKNKTNAQQPQD
jgi:hypothetical protein